MVWPVMISVVAKLNGWDERLLSCKALAGPPWPSAMLPASGTGGDGPIVETPRPVSWVLRHPGVRVVTLWVVHVPLRACELTPAPGKAMGGSVKRPAVAGYSARVSLLPIAATSEQVF